MFKRLTRMAPVLFGLFKKYKRLPSGFRYRTLEATPEQGYIAAKAELHSGEVLYRMHDTLYGVHPALVWISGLEDFEEAIRYWPDMRLAAGLPHKGMVAGFVQG